MADSVRTSSTAADPDADRPLREGVAAPGSALDRLHAALRADASRLAVRGPRSFLVDDDGAGIDESWRERCFQHLLVCRDGFDPNDAMRMALVLSRDPSLFACGPEAVAVAACRLLDGPAREAGKGDEPDPGTGRNS